MKQFQLQFTGKLCVSSIRMRDAWDRLVIFWQQNQSISSNHGNSTATEEKQLCNVEMTRTFDRRRKSCSNRLLFHAADAPHPKTNTRSSLKCLFALWRKASWAWREHITPTWCEDDLQRAMSVVTHCFGCHVLYPRGVKAKPQVLVPVVVHCSSSRGDFHPRLNENLLQFEVFWK